LLYVSLKAICALSGERACCAVRITAVDSMHGVPCPRAYKQTNKQKFKVWLYM